MKKAFKLVVMTLILALCCGNIMVSAATTEDKSSYETPIKQFIEDFGCYEWEALIRMDYDYSEEGYEGDGTDNIAVEKYAVYVDGKRYSRPKYTTVSITGLDPATTYQIEVETLDTSGNASERVALEVTTLSITTGIEETKAEENRNTYTLEGRKINGQPVRGQVSIIQTGQGATKQIIQ